MGMGAVFTGSIEILRNEIGLCNGGRVKFCFALRARACTVLLSAGASFPGRRPDGERGLETRNCVRAWASRFQVIFALRPGATETPALFVPVAFLCFSRVFLDGASLILPIFSCLSIDTDGSRVSEHACSALLELFFYFYKMLDVHLGL